MSRRASARPRQVDKDPAERLTRASPKAAAAPATEDAEAGTASVPTQAFTLRANGAALSLYGKACSALALGTNGSTDPGIGTGTTETGRIFGCNVHHTAYTLLAQRTTKSDLPYTDSVVS